MQERPADVDRRISELRKMIDDSQANQEHSRQIISDLLLSLSDQGGTQLGESRREVQKLQTQIISLQKANRQYREIMDAQLKSKNQ